MKISAAALVFLATGASAFSPAAMPRLQQQRLSTLLFSSNDPQQQAKETARDVKESARDATDTVQDAAKDVSRDAKGAVQDAKESVQDAVDNVFVEPSPSIADMQAQNTQTPNSEMSLALPWMKRPEALDGTMPGDVGFDPLGFAKSKDDLMNYREAEIKHARLAMLAAAGWPISELLDRPLAKTFNLDPVVGADDRAPSILNGGLGKISPFYWGACLAAAAAIDLYQINQSRKDDPEYFPGNLGFDPLGLYPQDKAGQENMQLKEIKNGRLAMIAITAFAFQEFASKLGVVDETPVFFKPLGGVLKDYANAGYITPDNAGL